MVNPMSPFKAGENVVDIRQGKRPEEQFKDGEEDLVERSEDGLEASDSVLRTEGKKSEAKPGASKINYFSRLNPDGTSDVVAQAATGEPVEIHFMDDANLNSVIAKVMEAIQKTEELKIEKIQQSIADDEPAAGKGQEAEFEIEDIQRELKELLGALHELQQEREMVEIDPASLAQAERLHNLICTEGHQTSYFLVTHEALKKIESRLPGNFLREIAGNEGETIGSKFIFESKDFILNLIFICQQEKEDVDMARAA
jgi:hypothetical protein